MADQEQMRYLSGGNRVDKVADAVGRWAASKLSLEQIKSSSKRAATIPIRSSR